jgi:hypothetical protein
MARFYFHLDEDGSTVEDFEGIDLPDLAAAHVTAVQAARGIMAHDIERGRISLSAYIDIAGPDGSRLGQVVFRDAVTITDRRKLE